MYRILLMFVFVQGGGKIFAKQYRLLIVDDQLGIRKLLYEVFNDRYSVIEAENGSDALQKTEEMQPDIILLDMKMPGMSGLETLKLLREKNCTVPVIMMTAFEGEVLLPKEIDLGPLYNIYKPFDLNKLRVLVEDVLKSNQNNIHICNGS